MEYTDYICNCLRESHLITRAFTYTGLKELAAIAGVESSNKYLDPKQIFINWVSKPVLLQPSTQIQLYELNKKI